MTPRPISRAELTSALADSAGPIITTTDSDERVVPLHLPDSPAPQRITTDGLDRIVAYEPDDLTITVEPGVAMARLQSYLGECGQWLPVEPGDPRSWRIGRLVATAEGGRLRGRWGGPRRHLIGIATMDARGVETRAGGRVVKNVAGYDLMKLHTGACETLGIVTEMTFRVVPLPEVEVGLVADRAAPGRVDPFLEQLGRSPVDPSALRSEWSSTGATPRERLILTLAGFREDLAEEERLARALAGESGLKFGDRTEGREACRRLRQRDADSGAAGAFSFRAFVSPAQVRPALDRFSAAAGEAGLTLEVVADRRTGQFDGLLRGAPDPGEAIPRLRRCAVESGGRFVITRWPEGTPLPTDHELILGAPPSSLPLMRALKTALDPERRLNPGLYHWGL